MTRTCPNCGLRHTDLQPSRSPEYGVYCGHGIGGHHWRCICGGNFTTPDWASGEREVVLTGGPLEHLRDAREVV